MPQRGSTETALVRPLEREVGDQADHADHDDAEDDLAGVQQRLRVGDHVADAGRRADQLGDDHVGPRPAEHEAQRLRDLRRGVRQQHAAHDARGVGAERVGGLDEVAPRRADDHRDHQHDLEEHADEDHEQLLRLADAGPQDQERDERGRGQVARERHERLEKRLDRLERAHRDAERHAERRRRARSRRRTRQTVIADVLGEAVLREQRQPSRSIVSGSARNVFDTKPPNVAMLHAATNTTKNAMPSATLRGRLTGTSGFKGVIQPSPAAGEASALVLRRVLTPTRSGEESSRRLRRASRCGAGEALT